MRALRIITALLILGSAIAWADTIYTVNVFTEFTATRPCTVNCTETITASFQYEFAGYASNGSPISSIVPGSLSVSANGFLGSVTWNGAFNGEWIALYDSGGDQIDIYGNLSGPFIGSPNQTLYMNMYSCLSAACQSAYGPIVPVASYIGQSYGSSVITAPEPSSLALLIVPASFLGWKNRHRKDPLANFSRSF